MSKVLVSFGQVHRHVINGVVIDKDCLVCMEEGGDRANIFRMFGGKFATTYPMEELDKLMKYSLHGVIHIEIVVETPDGEKHG